MKNSITAGEQDFDRQRPFLIGLCYRMLGSVADAEDIVQESYLRWQSAGKPELDSARAWYARVCTRLCLDQLKSAGRTRQQYYGQWLPEPILAATDDRSGLDETISMALMLTIQRLGPRERAVFLLHDVFGYEFTEVSEIMNLKPANCRQLAVRAHRQLGADTAPPPADEATVERLSGAFFEAIGSGDLVGLQNVLTEDVVLRSDGGGKALAAQYPVEGRQRVLDFLSAVFGKAYAGKSITMRRAWYNGAPGTLLYEDSQLVSAFSFQVDDERIVNIFVQRNPDKLQKLAAVGGPFDSLG